MKLMQRQDKGNIKNGRRRLQHVTKYILCLKLGDMVNYVYLHECYMLHQDKKEQKTQREG